MSESWRDHVVGDRMRVDQEFSTHIESSEFSRQQFGLLMMATTLEIEAPGDAEAARIVANTDRLPEIMPELDNVERQMAQAMGGGRGKSTRSGPGVIDSVKRVLGLGDSAEQEANRVASAESLVQAYADALQARLEETGKWDDIREMAID